MPDAPSNTNAVKDEDFKPVADDWKWKPGEVFRIETPVPADKYTLTVVKPVTFQEFQELVNNIIMPKRKDLGTYWAKELERRGLLEPESWKAAAEKAKANGHA